MQKKPLILVFAVLAFVPVFFTCGRPPLTPEQAIATRLSEQVDGFLRSCRELDMAVRASGEEDRLQALFLDCRTGYKKIEWAVEYFVPATARFINGPPVEEVERSGQVFPAAGLQVIEGLLFPHCDKTKRPLLLEQLQALQRSGGKCRTYFDKIAIFDWQVFDAAKAEVFRVETLGITGFDNPLTLKSSAESATCLEAVRETLARYPASREDGALTQAFAAAATYLGEHAGFDGFDRAVFIRKFADPVCRGIDALQHRAGIRMMRYNRLLNQTARTLFDPGAYNVNAYTPDPAAFSTPARIDLGRQLFSDPALSGDGTRSCRSCHQPERAFTDGLTKNTVLGNKTPLSRNTPTLLNAALQPSLFYDLRVNSLEDQAATVVQSEKEMHGSLRLSVAGLWKNARYREAFAAAFPRAARVGIDTGEVMNAIGAYVRSLVGLDSRFDRFMRGDDSALSGPETDGFNLFMGKARCATCHYLPLFNGTLPPRFMKIESEVIGVPAAESGHRVDPDPGRFAILPFASLRHSFKTPTLRNISRTAPYMHNGVFPTLEAVVDFYDRGGGQGTGVVLPNQTLPADSLHLSPKEKAALVAFMRSLDDAK